MSIHECEIKEISASGLINQVSVIIEIVKVFIEVGKLWLSGVRECAVRALLAHLELLTHYQVFNEVLVAVTKLALDCLGEPSVLFLWFVCVELLGVLLRVGKKLLVMGIR